MIDVFQAIRISFMAIIPQQTCVTTPVIITIAVVCTLLTIIGIIFYIAYVSEETREVAGNVVSFETRTSKSTFRVVHLLHVRLDSGLTVTAQVSPSVTIKVGSRVSLIATKMPIIGIERFRFKEFVKPPVNPNPLLQN
jgi:hypothetical protein